MVPEYIYIYSNFYSHAWIGGHYSNSFDYMSSQSIGVKIATSTVQFFDECPKLLTLKECDWGFAKFFCISTPMLESVVICDASFGGGSKVVISGANIKSFSYNELIIVYVHPDACIHVSSKFMIEREGREKEASHRVQKLILECCDVKHLVLSPDTLEACFRLNTSQLILPKQNEVVLLYVFLKIGIILNKIEGTVWIYLSSIALRRLLQKLPHLGCLVFRMPPCFLTQLKTIKIHIFDATEEELHAVRVLFRVSIVLDKFYISGGTLSQNKTSMLARESKFEITYIPIAGASEAIDDEQNLNCCIMRTSSWLLFHLPRINASSREGADLSCFIYGSN
ncbi:hypothetical protein SADUNF_Sadunf04G0006200 [Salix dunnii]|uniref:FBD domain-containing protein n=1 Tax=Salix dunnii TaxID=1413687 RepID=A0A835K9T7_9ROSI|nr:hypothetical protein SADUNF_Sadunf04G0006200 [Salix dunnii]